MATQLRTSTLATAAMIACALFLLGVSVPLIDAPPDAQYSGTIAVSVVFLSLPILLLYFLAKLGLPARASVVQLVGGIAAALLAGVLVKEVSTPIAITALGSLGQLAVVAWAGAIGALVALLLKDRNLLLPAACALAAVDLVIVLAPTGIVNKALQTAEGRAVFEAVAYQVPSVGKLQPAGFVGPADFLFLSMFYVAIHRFRMNSKGTLWATLIALSLYLLIVLGFGDSSIAGVSLKQLPALVPIGLAVLLANWREFNLTREEKVMTAAVLIICSIFVFAAFWIGANAAKPPADSSYPSRFDNKAIASCSLIGPVTVPSRTT